MNLKSKKDILVRNLLGSVVPIIAHDASFERRLLSSAAYWSDGFPPSI
jgi:hypothetical protein